MCCGISDCKSGIWIASRGYIYHLSETDVWCRHKVLADRKPGRSGIAEYADLLGHWWGEVRIVQMIKMKLTLFMYLLLQYEAGDVLAVVRQQRLRSFEL